jgi:hypothetical protein
MRDRISGFLILGAVLGGIGGVVCLLIGYLDYQIRSAGQDTPRAVTAAELYDNGPGDNAHIRLKLFALSNNYVYSTENGRWTGVWLAVYPSELEKNIPPKLILRNMDVSSEADVAKLVEREEFEGILMSSVPMRGADVNTELRQTWPDADWDHIMKTAGPTRAPAGSTA